MRFLALAAWTWLLAACGYHFPGEQEQRALLNHATLRLENTEAWNNRLLVARLRQGLEQRLGLTSAPGGTEIILHLEDRDNGVVTEGLSGLAIRRNIRLSLTPRIKDSPQRWPQVSGNAYMTEVDEDPIRTASFRERAEQEAVVRLVDNLAAALQAGLPSPGPR